MGFLYLVVESKHASHVWLRFSTKSIKIDNVQSFITVVQQLSRLSNWEREREQVARKVVFPSSAHFHARILKSIQSYGTISYRHIEVCSTIQTELYKQVHKDVHACLYSCTDINHVVLLYRQAYFEKIITSVWVKLCFMLPLFNFQPLFDWCNALKVIFALIIFSNYLVNWDNKDFSQLGLEIFTGLREHSHCKKCELGELALLDT